MKRRDFLKKTAPALASILSCAETKTQKTYIIDVDEDFTSKNKRMGDEDYFRHIFKGQEVYLTSNPEKNL